MITAHGGLRYERVTPDGIDKNYILDGPPPVPDEICVQTNGVEGLLVIFLRHALEQYVALGAMLKIQIPHAEMVLHDHVLTTDNCDSTVRLVRTYAKECLTQIAGHKVTETRLIRCCEMLQDLHDWLGHVNLERDSAPGLALISFFIPSFHIILSVSKTQVQKNKALMLWRTNSAKILRKL